MYSVVKSQRRKTGRGSVRGPGNKFRPSKNQKGDGGVFDKAIWRGRMLAMLSVEYINSLITSRWK
jgi:hypothetical protein